MLSLHLPLDVVLQQVLIDGEKVVATHVVVVVGHRVAKLLSVRAVFHIVGLVAIVVVVLALKGQRQSVRWTDNILIPFREFDSGYQFFCSLSSSYCFH